MRTMPLSALAMATVSPIAPAWAQQATAAQAIPPLQLGAAVLVVIVAVGAVWLGARRSTLLKDNLLPQIAPLKQPYSLGRWQMAFWFTLIFTAFIGIYVLTENYHTITPQALWLMGISAISGVSAVAVDVIKDSPADAASRGLQALGLYTYADVERVRAEIIERHQQLKNNPPPAIAQQLNLEIRDRQLLLTAYENAIRPFASEGWYKDITTDMNGAALHRVQTLAWTLMLGVVFVVGVIADHSMPQFDSSLLILLGISNAGYIGFKYPEPQQ
jgi:hypothetical protein